MAEESNSKASVKIVTKKAIGIINRMVKHFGVNFTTY